MSTYVELQDNKGNPIPLMTTTNRVFDKNGNTVDDIMTDVESRLLTTMNKLNKLTGVSDGDSGSTISDYAELLNSMNMTMTSKLNTLSANLESLTTDGITNSSSLVEGTTLTDAMNTLSKLVTNMEAAILDQSKQLSNLKQYVSQNSSSYNTLVSEVATRKAALSSRDKSFRSDVDNANTSAVASAVSVQDNTISLMKSEQTSLTSNINEIATSLINDIAAQTTHQISTTNDAITTFYRALSGISSFYDSQFLNIELNLKRIYAINGKKPKFYKRVFTKRDGSSQTVVKFRK